MRPPKRLPLDVAGGVKTRVKAEAKVKGGGKPKGRGKGSRKVPEGQSSRAMSADHLTSLASAAERLAEAGCCEAHYLDALGRLAAMAVLFGLDVLARHGVTIPRNLSTMALQMPPLRLFHHSDLHSLRDDKGSN